MSPQAAEACFGPDGNRIGLPLADKTTRTQVRATRCAATPASDCRRAAKDVEGLQCLVHKLDGLVAAYDAVLRRYRAAKVGVGCIVVSETEAPIVLVNLV